LEQNESEVTTLRGAKKTLSVDMKAQVGSLSDGVGDLKAIQRELADLRDENRRERERHALAARVTAEATCTKKDCGSRVHPDASFCGQCGTQQVCCSCGAQLPPGIKSDHRCGERAPEDKGVSAAEAPVPSSPAEKLRTPPGGGPSTIMGFEGDSEAQGRRQ